MNYKLIACIRIENPTSLWVTLYNGVPGTTEVPLTPGRYFILGDGTASDLLQHIEDRLVAGGFVFGGIAKVQFSINTQSHRVMGDLQGGGDLRIQWTDAGGVGRSAEYVRDALRYSGVSTLWTALILKQTGSRVHVGGYYPSIYLQEDLERDIPLAARFVPDSGNEQRLYVASRREYRIGVKSYGMPRENAYNEYHDFQDWHADACAAEFFRLYADITVATAYGPTNRYGYQAMTIIPQTLEMAPQQQGWHQYMEANFIASIFTE